MSTKNYFSEDVKEYMRLNGFTLIDNKGMHDGMIWQNDTCAVYFWQNRIEFHQQNGLGDFQLKNTYTGFDGHNMQHLIMILHCMDVITIESANKLANEKTEQGSVLEKISMSMPVLGMTRQN